MSPFWDWKTIETRHFNIHFDSKNEKIAQRSAHLFEEAHEILKPFFKWTPAEKTEIVLLDNTDAANGLSSAALRVGIVLMLTPPEPFFDTTFYDDWLRLLILHEYAHTLNVDTHRGFWKVLTWFFGDIIRPNQLWPRWMLEGLAVYIETRYTQSGRGRSSFWEGILRAAVRDQLLDQGSFITIDRMTDDNPTYPAGSNPYFFGYQLMNQVAKDPDNQRERTHDRRNRNRDGGDLLGTLSWRSGKRFPFLINDALEDLTGNDWIHYWQDWVQETRRRMTRQLRRIRKQPLTATQTFTDDAYEVRGVTISPDGKTGAFIQELPHRRSGLYLFSTKDPHQQIRIDDHILGMHLSFTEDSRYLFFSRLRRTNQFYTYSDLAVLDVQTRKIKWLTHGLRVRDPSLSPDGSTLAFTMTSGFTTQLAVAQLKKNPDGFQLEAPSVIYRPKDYGRVASPKFSRSGNSLVFSVHPYQKFQENLLKFDIRTRQISTLVADGAFNRFPSFGPKGQLYYVSNQTGVDNLFLYKKRQSKMLTNVETAIAYPAFSPEGDVYASLLTPNGLQLSKIKWTHQELSKQKLSISKATVSAPPAPDFEEPSPVDFSKNYPVTNYSALPSLWPRQWAPMLFSDFGGLFIGATVSGFDSTDRHTYSLLAGVDTQILNPDLAMSYSNRQLGPTFSGLMSWTTTLRAGFGSTLVGYHKKALYSVDVTFPFRFTFSFLQPFLRLNVERTYQYVEPNLEKYGIGRFVPSADLLLVYSDLETSALALSPERGHFWEGGFRVYRDIDHLTWKGLLSGREYWNLWDHSVLVGSAAASMASRNSAYLPSSVVVSGQSPRLLDGIGRYTAQRLNEMAIRGYANTFYVRSAVRGSAELRFPVARLFRGWSTNPLFFKNFYAFAFGDLFYFPDVNGSSYSAINNEILGSAGGGVRLSLDSFNVVPLILSLEYHKGLEARFGGNDQIIFSVLTASTDE